MQTLNALDIALQLYRQPALARRVQRNGLPPRVLSLIKIAAGSEEELALPVAHTPGEIREIREAAIFFLQNCLFQAGGDSYRVLGVEHGAPIEEIRRHKRWLLKWLHPDLNRNTWEAAYLQRVLAAWNDIAGDATMPETLPAPEALMRGQRRARPRYYRHRSTGHNAVHFESGCMLRRVVVVFTLSAAVFLAFRQFNGNPFAGLIQLPVLPGYTSW
jgi:hypothetical protein